MPRSLLITFAIVLAGVSTALVGSDAAQADDPTPSPSVSSSAVPPTTYYVDCSARGGGDGSSSAPWNGLANVDGHAAFQPGDHILFRRGTTCHGRLHAQGSGTSTAPIRISAYGHGAQPVLAGGGTPMGTATVELREQHDVVIDHLTITNHSSRDTTVYRSGILVTDDGAGRMRGIVLTKLHITDVESSPALANSRAYGGISVLASGGGSGFDGLLIQSNTIDHVGRTGIFVSNANFSISGARGYDRNDRITGNAVRWIRGDGIVLNGSVGGRIDHNVVAHASQIFPCKHCGPKGPMTASAAVWTSNSSGVRIDHNEAYGTNFAGGDGEGFDLDMGTTHAVLEDNYSHDNQGGGILVCSAKSSTIRFNIVQNNGRAQIVFTCYQPARNIAFLNNDIFVKSASTAAYLVRTGRGKGATGISFKNNLIWTQGKSIWQWPGRVDASSNTVVGAHSSSEPANTSWSIPAIRNPGTGKLGFGSLSGYKWRAGASIQRGVAVPRALTDILGRSVNAKHPARGAITG